MEPESILGSQHVKPESKFYTAEPEFIFGSQSVEPESILWSQSVKPEGILGVSRTMSLEFLAKFYPILTPSIPL